MAELEAVEAEREAAEEELWTLRQVSRGSVQF